MKQTVVHTSKPQSSGFTRTASTKRIINTPTADTRSRDGIKISPTPRHIAFADSTPSRTSPGAGTLPKAILKNKLPSGSKSSQRTPTSPEGPRPRFSDGIHPSPAPTQTGAVLPSVPDLSFTMNGTSANCHLPQMPATPQSDAKSAFFPSPSSLMSAISFSDPQIASHPGTLSQQQLTPSFGPSLFVTPPRERHLSYNVPGSGFASYPSNLFDSLLYPEFQAPVPGTADAGVNFMLNPFYPALNRSRTAASSYDAYLLQRIQFQEDQIRVLRTQLQRCTELYSALYATVQNIPAKSDSSSQTDTEKIFADASTIVDEELIGNGPCIVTDNPVLPSRPLENRNQPPVMGHVTPEQQAYLEMMANIQIALKNSGSNNVTTKRYEIPTPAVPSDASSDVSILCGNLAKQYLNMDMHCLIGKTNRLAVEQASFYGMHGSDVSFATKNYLERHGLTKSSIPRNGFLRTESIIEWSEEEDAEWDGSSRVQYFQEARRDAYFCNGQQAAGGHLHARRAAVLGGKENRPT